MFLVLWYAVAPPATEKRQQEKCDRNGSSIAEASKGVVGASVTGSVVSVGLAIGGWSAHERSLAKAMLDSWGNTEKEKWKVYFFSDLGGWISWHHFEAWISQLRIASQKRRHRWRIAGECSFAGLHFDVANLIEARQKNLAFTRETAHRKTSDKRNKRCDQDNGRCIRQPVHRYCDKVGNVTEAADCPQEQPRRLYHFVLPQRYNVTE